MLTYRFDISKLSQNITSYLAEKEVLFLLEDFKEYIIIGLINEYELPIRLKNIRKYESHLSVFKRDFIDENFHEFACTYSNMYRDLITRLNNNVYYNIDSINIGTNVLIINVEER